MDLVNFLAIGYKAAMTPLNPLAVPYVYKSDIVGEGQNEEKLRNIKDD